MAEAVTAGSHILLRDLSITRSGESFMVGDLAHGEFIEVPEIAVVVIGALRDGATVGDAAKTARAHAGTDVDVAQFVETLREVGFVASIDGVPIAADGPELTDGGRAGAAEARLARPLYSMSAMAVYALAGRGPRTGPAGVR